MRRLANARLIAEVSNTGIQHDPSGVVFTHQYVYVGSLAPIESTMLIGKDEEARCDEMLHEVYRLVIGVVAWAALTRAELAVYVQALQRRAHSFGIKDCKCCNLVIRHMERHKCGLKPVALQRPLELVGFVDDVFKLGLKSLRG